VQRETIKCPIFFELICRFLFLHLARVVKGGRGCCKKCIVMGAKRRSTYMFQCVFAIGTIRQGGVQGNVITSGGTGTHESMCAILWYSLRISLCVYFS